MSEHIINLDSDIDGKLNDPKSAASLKLGGFAFNFVSQAPDTLEFYQAGDFYTDPLFAYGDTVKLYRAGTKIFEGIITSTPLFGDGQSERLQYTAEGPFWYLEKLIYQQEWKVYDDQAEEDVATLKSHVFLGYDDEAEKINTGESIADAIAFAISVGAPLSLSTNNAATDAPSEDVTDLSVAEVIRRLLRWNPDCVTYFDYSTTPPTLHIVKESNLSNLTMSLKDSGEGQRISSIEYRKRDDMRPSGVVIKYERINEFDGQEFRQVEIDKYPPSADETDFDAIVMTIDLDGSRTSLNKQKVEAVLIGENSLDWWKDHCPELNDSRISELEIVPGSGDAGTELPRELKEGSIADWMSGVEEESATVTAKFNFKLTDDSGLVIKKENEQFSVNIRATNAVTRIYNSVSDSTPGEETPVGLAQGLYDALNRDHFEGTLVTVAKECDLVNPISRALRLLNPDGSLRLRATVQTASWDYDAGRTTYSFAPLPIMSVQDKVSLFRMNRKRVGAVSTVKIGSDASGESGAEVGYKGAKGNSTRSDSTEVVAGTPSAPSAGVKVGWREVTICTESGERKMLVYGSEDYE